MPEYLDIETLDVTSKNHKRREISPNFDVISIIEEINKEKSDKSRNGRLSPTSGAGYCSLQAFRMATEKVEEDFNACNVYWTKVGQLSEDIYIDSLKKSEHWVADQIRLTEVGGMTDDLQLGAYLDILAINNDGKLLIIEKKTCGKQIPTNVKPMHLNQVRLYMTWYALDGIIVYQSRDIGTIYGDLKGRQFDITYDYDDAFNQMSEIFFTRMCIDQKLMPDKPVSIKTESQCSFCPFIENCWRGVSFEQIHPAITFSEEYDLRVKSQSLAKEFLSEKNINIRREDLFKKINECRKDAGYKKIIKSKFEIML